MTHDIEVTRVLKFFNPGTGGISEANVSYKFNINHDKWNEVGAT